MHPVYPTRRDIRANETVPIVSVGVRRYAVPQSGYCKMANMQTQEHPDGDVTEPGFVWVYRYTYWDEDLKVRKTSKRFATREVIQCGLGEMIHASAKKIPIANLVDGAFAE